MVNYVVPLLNVQLSEHSLDQAWLEYFNSIRLSEHSLDQAWLEYFNSIRLSEHSLDQAFTQLLSLAT